MKDDCHKQTSEVTPIFSRFLGAFITWGAAFFVLGENATMSKKVGVGRSDRTPVKHYLLDKSLGQVCGVLSLGSYKVPCVASVRQPLICADLCGGDGLQTDDHEASPVIMAKHCQFLYKRGKSAKLEVIEKASNTYEELVRNCNHLPREIVTLTNGDARDYRLPKLAFNQPAFVHCDPNNVDQIPLSRPFVAGFNKFTTYLVTLGCNVGGLKRSTPEKREQWFEYVSMLVEVLPNHHDAILFWLNRDSAKWAYLLSIPKVWGDDFAGKAITQTNKMWTQGVSAVSYRSQPAVFNDELKQLFLTKKEYANI
jgi:hypothetical protein